MNNKHKEIRNIMWLILNKLNRMDKWGHAHTALRNITKGLPLRYTTSGYGKKLIQKAIKELARMQTIMAKPSTGEIHVSLNPRKTKEIKEFLALFR